MKRESLEAWGWNLYWQSAMATALYRCPTGLSPVPARVVGREGPIHLLVTSEGPRQGLVSGRMQFSTTEADLPLVGDWVAVQLVDDDQAVIHAVLERKTTFSRAVSGGAKEAAGTERYLAANLDVLAIMTGLDGNFNPRRAQRLATLARHGGVLPLWILSKADLPESEAKIEWAVRAAGEDPVVAVSSWTGAGLEALGPWLLPGMTIALTGSSGVGKTTLVNRLLESSLATQPVRAGDSKGRHTTSSRHLYQIPGGALLMDTPGLKTVGLCADADDLAQGFSDIEQLAGSCRFADCHHQGEPGCAVQKALADGTLDSVRWDGWQRQERELRHLALKEEKGTQRAERERWKGIHQQMKGFNKETRSRGG